MATPFTGTASKRNFVNLLLSTINNPGYKFVNYKINSKTGRIKIDKSILKLWFKGYSLIDDLIGNKSDDVILATFLGRVQDIKCRNRTNFHVKVGLVAKETFARTSPKHSNNMLI